MTFKPGASGFQRAGRALPHGDHEVVSGEHADLAEVDHRAGPVVPGGAQDDQLYRPLRAFELLDLGPQVQLPAVLDGQVVQPEHLPGAIELVRVG